MTLELCLTRIREAVPDPQAQVQCVQAVLELAAALGYRQDAAPPIVGLTVFETH